MDVKSILYSLLPDFFFGKIVIHLEKTAGDFKMEKETIKIPDREYFGYGNIYSGSRKEFNYKITPKDGILQTVVWYGKLCSEKSEPEASQEYPLDDRGLLELVDWLNGQYEQYLKK